MKLSKLDFVDGNMNVLLKLLERPRIQGNVQNPLYQISLEDAMSLLTKYIDNGQLTVEIDTKVVFCFLIINSFFN